MEQDELSFGQWLGQYRQALHIQRSELASRVGCAVVTLRKIEADERRPSREMAELLADQLSIPPQQRETFVRVARGELPLGRLAVARSGSEISNNLPYPATSLVGREREVEDVRSMLLRPEVRLLTLTGPPGVGKTRLALEVASRLLADFTDGVFLVPLASLQEPGLMLDAVAHAMQLGTSRGQPLAERLGLYLRRRRVVLLLDNFEHLLAGTPKLAQLLAQAPNLKLLVTSRIALEMSGEHRFTLLPLFVPPANADVRVPVTAAQAEERYPAVRLFIQRARAVNRSIALDDASLRAIGEICRRLDGLPLAIELAAARAALFTPQELLARLDDRFGLLLGARDLPERHLTLWRAIDWSYNLLSPATRQLFRRLSVFAGGCTLEAAQQVCNSDRAAGIDVAGEVAALVADSLLQRKGEYGGHSRFEMLETVREYALNQLAASGEAGMVEQQHSAYYLGLGLAAERAWDGPDEWDWLRRLVSERDNLRAVLRRAIQSGDAVMALRLNGALFSFWTLCSVLSEARRWLEDALSLPRPAGGSPDIVSAEAKALNLAGYVAATSADHSRALDYFERGLELYRTLGDSRGIAWSVRGCAFAHMLRDEYVEAEQFYNESLGLCDASQDTWGIAWSQYGLAFLKLARGDLAQAGPSLQSALGHFRRQDIPLGVFRALVALGYTLFEQGDVEGAEALYREGLVLSQKTPMLTFITTGVEGLGLVAAYRGEAMSAARLWGAAEAMREVTDERRWHVFERTFERLLAIGREQLSGAAWVRAWAEGRSLTAAQAVAEALHDPGVEPYKPGEMATFAATLASS